MHHSIGPLDLRDVLGSERLGNRVWASSPRSAHRPDGALVDDAQLWPSRLPFGLQASYRSLSAVCLERLPLRGRGIEDDHYWVVEEADGALVDAGWRIERETDGWTVINADDIPPAVLGYYGSTDAAVEALRRHLA